MAVSCVGHGACSFNGTGNVTINMTGATLFVVCLTGINNVPSLHDANGNTYTYKNTVISGARQSRWGYCIAPSGSLSSLLFSIDAVSAFDSLVIAGFDPTSPVFDTEGAGGSSGGATGQPGSLTPGGSPNLIFSTVGGDINTSIAIDSSYSVADFILNIPYNRLGGAIGWLEQAAASAQNPTWTPGSNGSTMCMNTFSFTFTGGAAPSKVPYQPNYQMAPILAQ